MGLTNLLRPAQVASASSPLRGTTHLRLNSLAGLEWAHTGFFSRQEFIVSRLILIVRYG
jgi:hypothetical protein